MHKLAPPANDRSRHRLYTVIFEADTPAGKIFDFALIAAILASVAVVMFDSINDYHVQYGALFYRIEWFFTALFTVEYIVRLYCVENRLRYARSFFGAVDLLAVLPTYISLLVPGAQYLLVIRVLRVLRVFRLLKIVQYVSEAELLLHALRLSRRKIFVFLFSVLTMIVVLGSIMYLIEGERHGFTSIPASIYWAIVTLTTVGYGDITPHTPAGQILASFIMILGYSIIAVPTGIVTVELSQVTQARLRGRRCATCGLTGHEADARYCRHCGTALEA